MVLNVKALTSCQKPDMGRQKPDMGRQKPDMGQQGTGTRKAPKDAASQFDTILARFLQGEK